MEQKVEQKVEQKASKTQTQRSLTTLPDTIVQIMLSYFIKGRCDIAYESFINVAATCLFFSQAIDHLFKPLLHLNLNRKTFPGAIKPFMQSLRDFANPLHRTSEFTACDKPGKAYLAHTYGRIRIGMCSNQECSIYLRMGTIRQGSILLKSNRLRHFLYRKIVVKMYAYTMFIHLLEKISKELNVPTSWLQLESSGRPIHTGDSLWTTNVPIPVEIQVSLCCEEHEHFVCVKDFRRERRLDYTAMNVGGACGYVSNVGWFFKINTSDTLNTILVPLLDRAKRFAHIVACAPDYEIFCCVNGSVIPFPFTDTAGEASGRFFGQDIIATGPMHVFILCNAPF